MDREQLLRNLRVSLLQSRGFRYLRYLHLRDFVSRVGAQIKSLGVCGAGQGIAELALAVEFPEIEFTLTDVVAAGRPNYWTAMQRCMQWRLRNLRFGVWDMLQNAPCQFDAVVSTEVLEHIEDAEAALRNARNAALKAFYCLTPFATRQQNADAERRLQAYRQHGHFVCGFDQEFFLRILGDHCRLYGAYWSNAGLAFRRELAKMTTDQIAERYNDLTRSAKQDIKWKQPSEMPCLAVKAIITGDCS